MSMIRQVMLLLAWVVALSVGGTAIVSAASARDSLQAQWQVRNGDAAHLLAVLLSQQKGDLARVELLLTTQFNTGHYSLVRLQGADGGVLFERTAPVSTGAAPAWLSKGLPLSAGPGQAVVSNGWARLGVLEIESHPGWAYDALWVSVTRTAAWVLLAGAIAAVAAVLGVRAWRRGLETVVDQADALRQGRFAEIEQPRTPELSRLAAGMNAMVRSLRALFESQATQIDSLRRQAQHDAATGLANRAHLLAQLERTLGPAGEAAAGAQPRFGALLLMRLQDLGRTNQRAGRRATDRMLGEIGSTLESFAERLPGAFAGRLNGSDLALFLPTSEDVSDLARELAGALHVVACRHDPQARAALGVVTGLTGGDVSSALARADEALARAEQQGAWAVAVVAGAEVAGLGEEEWQRRLEAAVDAGRGELLEFPLVDRNGQVLHLECPLRVQLEEGGAAMRAAAWLPMAARGQLVAKVDRLAIQRALESIVVDGVMRSVHVAGASLSQELFVEEVASMLAAVGPHAGGLSLEIAEADAARFPGWRYAFSAWKPLGVRLGVENAGEHARTWLTARGLGLDYLKLDGRVLRRLGDDSKLADYVAQLVTTARGLGVAVYAEGIDRDEDLRAVWELGLDGATGAAIRAAA
ncbi:MAG: bifunctional diguanylate cyclase/phosphodiesterase [Rubrivivax sp.]